MRALPMQIPKCTNYVKFIILSDPIGVNVTMFHCIDRNPVTRIVGFLK